MLILQVDETRYMRTPTPPLRQGTSMTLADPAQSTLANYDTKSDPSGITSMAKTPGLGT